jgi:rhamnogalacturonan endolyase
VKPLATMSATASLPPCNNDSLLTQRTDGAASNLAWTSAKIVKTGSNYIDVRFDAAEGEMHWVIFNGLAGAYQYFVNRALPVLGEFRTLWRLDNETFTSAYNADKDGVLPPLSEYAASTKIQDETWKTPEGGYLTKYDWSGFVREQEYWGVYGEKFGSWYLVSIIYSLQLVRPDRSSTLARTTSAVTT